MRGFVNNPHLSPLAIPSPLKRGRARGGSYRGGRVRFIGVIPSAVSDSERSRVYLKRDPSTTLMLCSG